MNTNRLKRFARSARSKLMAQVAAKLEYVLTADSALLREKAEQISKLREELNRTGKAQLIEKVAYTWFNRLVALRFMDVNDFQPLGLRIVTPKNGFTLPEILDEAKRGNFPPEFNIQHSTFKITRIEDLLDGKIPSSNPQNEVYRELLIASCNHLNTVFPFLFERINDYTELLLPDDLTSEFSILNEIRDGMDAEDCSEVEIIGWLYQFYIAEKKDEIYASKSRVKKEDIPAVTQLFTPRWIVEYMVQNTVGKLWLQNRPNSGLKQFMPYYIESASSRTEDYLKINSPEEITLLDPAMGSGHILVYGFELLTRIYEEEGYNHSEIPGLIISKNLFGLEIDERAAQLAGFALMMKARQYNRRFFNKPVAPKTYVLEDLILNDQEIKDTLSKISYSPSWELLHDLSNMQQASNFGSLIIPHTQTIELEQTQARFAEKKSSTDLFLQQKLEFLFESIGYLIELGRKYCCVVTNPPYMGAGNMNPALSEFVKLNYTETKADLMACFMERVYKMLTNEGLMSMINQQSWMFIPSYLNFRKKVLKEWRFDSLIHLGPHTFPEISGEVVQNASFTVIRSQPKSNTVFIRLIDYETPLLKQNNFPNQKNHFECLIKNLLTIKGHPFAYWINSQARLILELNPSLREFGEPRPGLQTSNNDRFLRYWFELEVNKIGFNLSREVAIKSKFKWFPHNKGGKQPRKWYGNNLLVINFENDGKELKHWLENNPNDPSTKHWSRNLRNYPYYFKNGITWSSMSSNQITARINGQGFTFDTSGPTLFVQNNIEFFCGILNSSVFSYFVDFFSQTMSKGTNEFSRVPIVFKKVDEITELVKKTINISKQDWNRNEISFEYKTNPLLHIDNDDNLSLKLSNYIDKSVEIIYNLQNLEHDINQVIISIYNLQEELNPKIDLSNLTIFQDEVFINDKTGKLVLSHNELIKKLISHFIGTCFGRYSIDKEGLILANQGETFKEYLEKVGKSRDDIQFLPDEDNIIPVLEDEWFEDDITGRFHQFLKVTFGAEEFSKNLSFIEECLGKDVRSWFVKDFYSDHIKRYKKRPIYWMFSSPNGSFNVLIYMHRYTPDTLNLILNKYLRPFQDKLRARREYLVSMQVGGQRSAAGGLEIAKAMKEQDKIDKILLELKEYEREVFYPLALERIKIDLDDGVLVNYNKFGKAVKLVPGLNDPETKKKVKGFDWIDVSEIKD
ncbi:MAG: BREX-1 system adenine-specific DNA-methyltransferase PglX [Bacteroidales bacterium]|nr:BREX-1 system adenine-specific DNA-methyltransferase PglX [Bacteroidales bacterium]